MKNNSSQSPGDLRQTLVGGPLLGNRLRGTTSNYAPWQQFEPLITPEVPLEKRQRQRFILLPHSRYITVLAYKTGAQIATLVPAMEEDETDEASPVMIESVCLAKFIRKIGETSAQDVIDRMVLEENSDQEDAEVDQTIEEVLVLAGCRDGTIREFSLKCLENSSSRSGVKCGAYHIEGAWHRPRRVIQVARKEPILHITVPPLNRATDEGVLAYVAIQTKGLDRDDMEASIKNEKANQTSISVLRVLLPHFDNEANVSLSRKGKDDIQRKWQLDKFRCRVGKDKAGSFIDSTPFRFMSIAKPTASGHAIFAVLARANSIHVYYDHTKSKDIFPAASFTMPPENPISALHISVNGNDIACGHYRGQVTVVNDILSKLEKYHHDHANEERATISGKNLLARLEDPKINNNVTTKVHWHSHPVNSVVYDSMSSPLDPIIYSGGEEAVLVTWQVGQGKTKPAHVLPRVALGGIVHVTCTDRVDDKPENGILVYCEDNSLQLFESHNKGRVWKIQGLGYHMQSDTRIRQHEMSIQMDPRAKGDSDAQVVVVGMQGAPGFIQWYDPVKQRLASSLEVAPYNRVSKTEANENAMPVPSVASYAFADNGNELITVDEVATENTFIGACDDHGKEGSYGVVTTIRFWSWNETVPGTNPSAFRAPYNLTAAMTYPHGPKNRVSALASSRDGSMACTVSNDEKAFRLWHKIVQEEGDETRRVPSWACRFKVTSPAGFSNFRTKREGVSFSSDGSLVAIGYGNMITLWESEEARFLHSLRHLEGYQGTIDLLQFVDVGNMKDLLLVQSEYGVSLQSPFGTRGHFKGWSWGMPMGTKHAKVSCAQIVETGDYVAISIFDSNTGKSRVVLVDASTGTPAVDKFEEDIDGVVSCMVAAGKRERRSNWEKSPTGAGPSIKLYNLTKGGELLLAAPPKDHAVAGLWKDNLVAVGPTLDVADEQQRKRRRASEDFSSQPMESLTKKTALEIFGLAAGESTKATAASTADLPSLSGNFVRAFVGRRLLRRKPADDMENQ